MSGLPFLSKVKESCPSCVALEVTTDDLLGLKTLRANGKRPSRKVQRRLEKIEELPPHQQATLLKTIDTFLKGAAR